MRWLHGDPLDLMPIHFADSNSATDTRLAGSIIDDIVQCWNTPEDVKDFRYHFAVNLSEADQKATNFQQILCNSKRPLRRRGLVVVMNLNGLLTPSQPVLGRVMCADLRNDIVVARVDGGELPRIHENQVVRVEHLIHSFERYGPDDEAAADV